MCRASPSQRALFCFSHTKRDESPKPPLRFKTGSRLSASHRALPVAPLRAEVTTQKEKRKAQTKDSWYSDTVRVCVSVLCENLITPSSWYSVIFRFDTFVSSTSIKHNILKSLFITYQKVPCRENALNIYSGVQKTETTTQDTSI